MAPVCHIVYLGLSNQRLLQRGKNLSNFLKIVKKKRERLLARDLPLGCVHWVLLWLMRMERKRLTWHLLLWASGCPNGLLISWSSGASQPGNPISGSDHTLPAPITFTSSPNWNVSKLLNFLPCILSRMKHTWTQEVAMTLVFLRFLVCCARFPKWGRETGW